MNQKTLEKALKAKDKCFDVRDEGENTYMILYRNQDFAFLSKQDGYGWCFTFGPILTVPVHKLLGLRLFQYLFDGVLNAKKEEK